MKQYNHFGEYMFDLLFGPLKKGKKAVNQFYIFFKVIGRVFDGLKEAAFRVRDETNIATASPVMLPIHGQDRDMLRLVGESIEGYRTRLAMKGIIASWAGTGRGIKYAMAALGYEHSTIEPVYASDPTRWAEFVVQLGPPNSIAVREPLTVYEEIQRIKEASSKLAYFTIIHDPAAVEIFIGVRVSSYTEQILNSADSLILVRNRAFDSTVFLAGNLSSYKEESFL